MKISDVKQELSSDEKVLESAFKLETLYKKYKFVIWGAAVVLVLFFAGKTAVTAMEEARLSEANSAFMTLQSNPDDAKALAALKEKNPELFELYRFAQAAKEKDVKALKAMENSQNDIVADASRYTAAVLEKKSADSKLYREMMLLQEAYLAIESGDRKLAKEKLELIDPRSSLSTLVLLLKHSTIKGK
ncbi:MAG: hypothetical protein ABXS92_06135 [Sulfurimonas sp.]